MNWSMNWILFGSLITFILFGPFLFIFPKRDISNILGKLCVILFVMICTMIDVKYGIVATALVLMVWTTIAGTYCEPFAGIGNPESLYTLPTNTYIPEKIPLSSPSIFPGWSDNGQTLAQGTVPNSAAGAKEFESDVANESIWTRLFGQSNQSIAQTNRSIRYMDGIDAIYWINLDRSPDRRSKMEALFQDDAFDNIPKIRMAACDGKQPEKVYKKLYLKRKTRNDLEYACLLSHLETIRTIADSNYDVALIMEDDNTLEFKKYWKKTIKQVIDGAPNDWDIIQLCYMSQKNSPTKEYTFNSNLYVSACAYLIKRSSAQSLIHKMYRNGKYYMKDYINNHADVYLFNELNTYTYQYPYFIYKTNNDSLLHPGDLKEHEYSKKQIEKMYKLTYPHID
jgi:GR25 family glycosyltransferase involved in LPS biosynthesis